MEIKNQIITKLKDTLTKRSDVYAMWLEGADAIDTADEYSDIDIYIDVEDDKIRDVMELVEDTLASIRPLDYRYNMDHPHPKLEQCIYHLEGTSDYLMIDFCYQLHSRNREECVFLEGNTLEACKVIFDKDEVINYKPYVRADYREENLKQLKELDYRYGQHSRVIKYIRRKKYLEAYAYYNKYVLDPIITLLRMKYTPANTYFYLIHISDHIPTSDRERLEQLACNPTIESIEENIGVAKKWYNVLREEIIEEHYDM